MNLDEVKRKVSLKTADWNSVRRRVVKDEEDYKKAQEQTQRTLQAQEIAQAVAKQVQEEAHSSIAGVVSECLSAVFDDPYQFRIIFKQMRGKTEAQLVFEKNSCPYDPIDSSGGGVVDLAAFALRLSCLMLSQPPVRKILIMDEPLKFLSQDYRQRVRTLFERLSKEMNVQFILVTHILELEMGNVIRL